MTRDWLANNTKQLARSELEGLAAWDGSVDEREPGRRERGYKEEEPSRVTFNTYFLAAALRASCWPASRYRLRLDSESWFQR